jgi:hypothetical protein
LFAKELWNPTASGWMLFTSFVATDVMRASGRAMLDAIVAEQSARKY